MSKAIILLSGGLDSVVSLAIIKQKFTDFLALTFNYGQKSYFAEKKSSEKIAEYYNIQHKVIDLPWLNEISTSSLNNANSVPIIDIDMLDDNSISKKSSNSVWVPNRNALFVNIAACYCEAFGYDTIVIGANKEEAVNFKDNSIYFVNAINNSLKNSTNSSVHLIAPLIDFNKEEIVKKAIEYSVPFDLLHSCYVSNDIQCGQCESCMRLKRALLLNNRQDIINKIFKR